MTKYIRSLQNLRDLTEDIFDAPAISLDTKAIVLFLAGSMHSAEFVPWIDRIAALDPLNAKFKAVNNIRAELGPICSSYLMLKILNKISDDICSDELQQFINFTTASDSKMLLFSKNLPQQ